MVAPWRGVALAQGLAGLTPRPALARSMSSLTIIQALRAINSIIQVPEKLLSFEMWNSMKKVHGIGLPNKRRKNVSFLYPNKKSR